MASALGDLIARLRLSVGITSQRELARRAGISRNTVNKLETGKSGGEIEVETLNKIADALALDPYSGKRDEGRFRDFASQLLDATSSTPPAIPPHPLPPRDVAVTTLQDETVALFETLDEVLARYVHDADERQGFVRLVKDWPTMPMAQRRILLDVFELSTLAP